MATIHRHRITEASAWTSRDLEGDTSWDLSLSEAQTDELRAACADANASGLSLARITADNFPLPRCQPVLDAIRTGLRDGRGFTLLHGFPVAGERRQDIELMYWGFCAHLGEGVTQNSDGSLLHYVTEGTLRPSQGTRGVGDPGKVPMHVDLADCVSLLCVRQAADSPPSRLSSSTTLHNELLERAPDQLERLYDGFVWDRQNEHDPSETPTTGYRVPFFSVADGRVSCRYNRHWMVRALERRGGDGFSPEDAALLDLVDDLTRQNRFEFEVRPGDVQFVNNYTVLHGRAPHTPAASEAETRLLLRLWFDMEGVRPLADESIVRYGVIRHGRLGWSADDVLAGLEGRVHVRRPSDQAPLAT